MRYSTSYIPVVVHGPGRFLDRSRSRLLAQASLSTGPGLACSMQSCVFAVKAVIIDNR